MNTTVTEDEFNRLSAAFIEKFGDDYEEAIARLNSLKLILICGEAIASSRCLQAALLTAINSGKRAFLGGVQVNLPSMNIPFLFPCKEATDLRKEIERLGVSNTDNPAKGVSTFSLTFGLPAEEDQCLEVVCNSWQGGFATNDTPIVLEANDYLPLGGIAAGALAVGAAFLKVSGLDHRCADFPAGVSLWRPDLYWQDPLGVGKNIDYLPKSLWLLGLGHLGQAYLWNLSFLPYKDPADLTILLQDFDKIIKGNYTAGVLSEAESIGSYKTRVCSKWMEERGFKTIITERKFNEFSKREGDEPFVALCGFDNASARTCLEDAGFDLVIETGLGGSLASFDDIVLHTFPNGVKTAREIWEISGITAIEPNPNVLTKLQNLFSEDCGILALTLAGKAISSSFVGVFAGALVVGELLRATNCEGRYEQVHAQIRNLKFMKAFAMKNYTFEMARNGVVEI